MIPDPSLHDEAMFAAKEALYEQYERNGKVDRVCAEATVETYAAMLTADGPVILLPDEGQGVRVATWAEVLRYSEEYRRLQVSDVLEIAGEVAE